MDLLKGYGGDDDSDDIQNSPQTSIVSLPSVNLTPHVVIHRDVPKSIAVIDSKTNELYYNPKYDELFQSDVNFFYVQIDRMNLGKL